MSPLQRPAVLEDVQEGDQDRDQPEAVSDEPGVPMDEDCKVKPHHLQRVLMSQPRVRTLDADACHDPAVDPRSCCAGTEYVGPFAFHEFVKKRIT